MIKIELSFSKDDVQNLVARAIGSWGANPEYCTVYCDSNGRAGGYFGIKVRSKSQQITLNHDVIVAAIAAGSAAKGNPVDPASVKFNFIEGRGHGGAQSFSAKATPADAGTNPVTAAAGKLTFPFPITLTFDEKETKELYTRAVQRENGIKRVIYVTLSETSVGISVELTSGQQANVNLDAAQLKQTLADELSRAGYSVEADGVSIVYTPGSGEDHHHTPSRTTAHVKLTALPLG